MRRALRRLGGALAPLAMMLALGGCAVGPKFVRPAAPLEAAWHAPDTAQVLTPALADTAWWRTFNDPTLDSLVAIAYRQNLPLQVAGVRIYEARARLGIATGQKYPQVQAAFGSLTGVQVSQNAANSRLADHNFWDLQLGFDAAWELDFWGKFRKGVRAEEANYLSTIADYQDGLVSLTAEVARTYAVIRTFEVLIDQARQNVTVQEEGRRIAESRHRHGATSELDVAQAITLLESTRASIPILETDLAQAQNALCTLLGQPTGTVETILSRNTGIPTPPAQVAVSVPAEMLRRRPDIRSVELQAMAQSDRIGVARADLYPSFSLFGTIGTQTSSNGGPLSGSSSFSDIFGPKSWFFSFGPSFFWPLFNYGRITNNVRLQDARLQQLLVQYQSSVLLAAQEVEDGMVGFLKAQEATVSQQNAANSAQRAVDLSMVQYREGAVDFQRVLDAQRSLLQEQNALAQTRSSATTNLIALYKALGGGWEISVGQPVVSDSTQIEMQHRTNWGNYFDHSPTAPPSNSNESSKSSRSSKSSKPR
jgi:NodT family efflux transporter outer membrane factor (OMF) lipoprotein